MQSSARGLVAGMAGGEERPGRERGDGLSPRLYVSRPPLRAGRLPHPCAPQEVLAACWAKPTTYPARPALRLARASLKASGSGTRPAD